MANIGFEDLNLSDYPEAVASIKRKEDNITGGRTIVYFKSNQLFTGQFEKVDMDAFISIWNRYKLTNKTSIKPLLMQQADAMIRNYNGEVCPIEVMLYTSNVIANRFVDKKLVDDVAEVVFLIFKKNEKFFRSIKHILKVWKWDQAINVCEIAAGKIAAYRDSAEDMELIRDIYNEFHYNEDASYGCFRALMESKKSEFVVDILDMVHDLSGTETDKQIGNIFKRDFVINFPDYSERLDSTMFADSKLYVRDLIRKMLDPKRHNNMVARFKDSDATEQQSIVQAALNRIVNDDRTGSPYEAINVLKSASDESISEKLFETLNLRGSQKQYSRNVMAAIICNYFGTINYPPAIKAFQEISSSNDYYAAVRVALFFQDKINSDEIIEDFLSETKPDQIKMYLSGFFNLGPRVPHIRAATVSYLSKNLSEEKLSNAITNYNQMVQEYRRLYEPQVGDLIKTWFGMGTIWNTVQLRIQDQMACLNVIKTIIDDSNYSKYDSFLYYVAEEGRDFSPVVSQLAKNILKSLRDTKIRA